MTVPYAADARRVCALSGTSSTEAFAVHQNGVFARIDVRSCKCDTVLTVPCSLAAGCIDTTQLNMVFVSMDGDIFMSDIRSGKLSKCSGCLPTPPTELGVQCSVCIALRCCCLVSSEFSSHLNLM